MPKPTRRLTGTGSRRDAVGQAQPFGERGHQQRMARVDEIEVAAPRRSPARWRPCRGRGAPWPAPRPARPGLGRRSARSAASAPTRARQLAQDAHDLGPLLVLERHDVVVQLHRRHRLDEQARAGAGAAVDDAGELAAVLGLQEEHVAIVARGDELVLQEPLGVLALGGTTPSPTGAAPGAAPMAAAQSRRAAARRRRPPPPTGGSRGGSPTATSVRSRRPPTPGGPGPGRSRPRPRGGRSRRRPRRRRPRRGEPPARGGAPRPGRRRGLGRGRAGRGRAAGRAAASRATPSLVRTRACRTCPARLKRAEAPGCGPPRGRARRGSGEGARIVSNSRVRNVFAFKDSLHLAQ